HGNQQQHPFPTRRSSDLGERVFKTVWSKIDEGEPPEPTRRDANVGKAVGAAALEAATLAAAKAAANRASARSFHYHRLADVCVADRKSKRLNSSHRTTAY